MPTPRSHHTFRTNPEVAHAWIYAPPNSPIPGSSHQPPTHARNPNGSLYYEGDAIYSYGPHYPIAVRISPDAILLTHEPSSVTTAKHRNLVRQAANHLDILHIPCISDPHHLTTDSLAGELLDYARLHYEHITALPKRAYRKISDESTKLRQAIDALSYISRRMGSLRLATHSPQAVRECYETAHNLQEALDADPRYREAMGNARLAAVRSIPVPVPDFSALSASLDEAIQRWRDGKRSSVPNHSSSRDYDLLRLHDATVFTSRGISLDAPTVYTFLKALFERVPDRIPHSLHPETDLQWSKLPDDLPPLGPYKATYIGERGGVKVGCHIFPASEIWNLAISMSVPTNPTSSALTMNLYRVWLQDRWLIDIEAYNEQDAERRARILFESEIAATDEAASTIHVVRVTED